MSAATTTAAAAIISKIPKLPSHHFTLLPKTLFTKPFEPLNISSKPFKPFLSLLRASDTDPFSSSEQEEEEVFEEGFDDEEDEVEESDEDETGEVGRLYVGNLPYAMTSTQLSEVFVEAGRVVSVEIVYDRVTDRSRGFAFVTMGTIKEAKEAIRMLDGSQVGGRTVKVNFPEVPRGGEREVMGPKIRAINQSFVDSPHKLYAGNLSWAITSQGLKDAFFDQPGLLSAKVVYDRATGRSRGFGFLTFSSSEALESALANLNGVELEGRPLRLNMAEERSSTTPLARKDSESSFQSGEVLSGFGN